MDNTKKRQAILYVEANRVFFYPGVGGETLQVIIPQDIVGDLEILNPQKLSDLIVQFFQTQKIPPSEVLCIFAPAIVFQKDFAIGEKKESIQQFLDYVPFDDVLSKSFISNKKLHAFAINAQFYAIIKQVCEKSSFTLAGVVAYTSLTDMLPELAQRIDFPLLLTKFDSCKQFTLTSGPLQEEVHTDKTSPKKDNKRVYILLGIMGVLGAILVIMIFMTFHATPAPTVNTPRSLPTVAVPTPTISANSLQGSRQGSASALVQ